MKLTQLRLIFTLFVTLVCASSVIAAENEQQVISYVEIDPVIVTNFLREKGKKPGFVQLQAQITVHSTVAHDTVEKHMPLIRHTIIEVLSFTDEATIKDITQRTNLRKTLSSRIKKALNDLLGHEYAEDLVITHYMWG